MDIFFIFSLQYKKKEMLLLKKKLAIALLWKEFEVSGKELWPSDSGCIYLTPFAQS